MALPVNIRVNTSAPFPSNVNGSGPVTITKQNGIWTVGFNSALLPPLVNPTIKGAITLEDINGNFYAQLAFPTVGQSALQFQGQGNSATTSLILNPGPGTLSSGTISEVVIEQTFAQAFGGNYGRFSFSNFTGLSGISGLIGEFGGTVAPSDFAMQTAYESPAGTFNSTFFWKCVAGTTTSEDYQTGQVQFGAAGPVPPVTNPFRPVNGVVPNIIALTMPNLASAGTQDSNAILWEGKGYDGTTQHGVWWRQRINVTAQAGTSNFQWQQNLNGAGWSVLMTLTDGAALTVGKSGTTAGSVALVNATSGSITVAPPTGALGAQTLTLPASTGTVAITSNLGLIRVALIGVNFNSANTDNPVTIPLPPGISRYAVNSINISNASASISTATIGVFTGTGGGGQTIAATQSITVTQTGPDTNNNFMRLTQTNATTEAYNDATLQVRIVNAQGSAATADVIINILPLT